MQRATMYDYNIFNRTSRVCAFSLSLSLCMYVLLKCHSLPHLSAGSCIWRGERPSSYP